MSTYLCFTIPQQGNLNPMLAIVQELVARGEQATCYLTEAFRQPIEETGAIFRGYLSHLNSGPDMTTQNAGSISNGARFLQFNEMLFEDCQQLLPMVLKDIEGQKVDGIIYGQSAPWGRMLAQILHVPGILIRTTYATNEQFQLFPDVITQSTLPEEAETLAQQRASLNARVRQFCIHYGLEPFDFLHIFSLVEPLTLMMLPRAFQYAGDTFDSRFQFVGPCILSNHDATTFPLERLHNQSVLYISLGTSFNNRPDFYNECFHAFADFPSLVVLAIGKQVQLEDLDPAPENFLVHAVVPQLDVLTHTSIFITHGGMNSTMEAFSSGVPLIVVPQTIEQTHTARRVEELGLGIALDTKQIHAETLREAVNAVADRPDIRLRVKHMQDAIANAGGVQAAVNLILKHMRTHHTVNA